LVVLATRRLTLSGFKLSSRRRAAIAIQGFKAVELPVQFALSILAARALSPSQFGIATILISVQALYVAIATFGFDEMLQRALARAAPDEESIILATAFRARALSAGSGLVLASVSAGIFAANGSPLAASVLMLGVAGTTMVAANGYLSVGLARYSVIVPAWGGLASWLLPVALVLSGELTTSAAYIAALAAGSCLRLLICVRWYRRTSVIAHSVRRQLRSAPRLLNTLRAHFALVAYNVTDLVLARHGDVFVAGVVGIATASIGAYALAFQITAACNQFLLLGLGAIGLTRLSEEQDNPAALLATWRRLTVIVATLALGPLSVVVLGAPELVRFALGTKYPGLVTIIDALAATQWAARIGGGGTNIAALLALGRMGYVARTALIGAAVNLLLDASLAPLFGVLGLALGSGLAILGVGVANIHRLVGLTPANPGSRAGQGAGRVVTGGWQAFPFKPLAGLTVVFGVVEAAGVAEADLRVRLILGAVIGTAWLIGCLRELKPR
jgi:O-antigen/teichoic acid export membrane protein